MSASGEVALPGAHLQGHLVLLLMLVGCRVIIISRGGGSGGPPWFSLRLLQAHEQLEGWLGHRVWHVVGDINLGSVRGRRLREPGVGGGERQQHGQNKDGSGIRNRHGDHCSLHFALQLPKQV